MSAYVTEHMAGLCGVRLHGPSSMQARQLLKPFCCVGRDTSGLTCLHPAGKEGMRTVRGSAEVLSVLWIPSEKVNL